MRRAETLCTRDTASVCGGTSLNSSLCTGSSFLPSDKVHRQIEEPLVQGEPPLAFWGELGAAWAGALVERGLKVPREELFEEGSLESYWMEDLGGRLELDDALVDDEEPSWPQEPVRLVERCEGIEGVLDDVDENHGVEAVRVAGRQLCHDGDYTRGISGKS